MFKIGFGQKCGESSKSSIWNNAENWKASLAKENSFLYQWNEIRAMPKPVTPSLADDIVVNLPVQSKKFATTLGRGGAQPGRPHVSRRAHPGGTKHMEKTLNPDRMATQCVWEPNLGLRGSAKYEDQLDMYRRGVDKVARQQAAGFSITGDKSMDTRHTHAFPWGARPDSEKWKQDARERGRRSQMRLGVKPDVADFLQDNEFFKYTSKLAGSEDQVAKIARDVQRKLQDINQDTMKQMYTSMAPASHAAPGEKSSRKSRSGRRSAV